MLPSLTSSCVDLKSGRQKAKLELLNKLRNFTDKPKTLFLDERAEALLNMTIDVADIKKLGYSNLFKVGSTATAALAGDNVVFLFASLTLSKELEWVKQQFFKKQSQKKINFFMLLSDFSSKAVGSEFLKEFPDIRFDYFLSLTASFYDSDLVCLEVPGNLKNYHGFRSLTGLNYFAKFLYSFQQEYGKFRKIYAAGKSAKIVADHLLKQKENEKPCFKKNPLKFSGVLLDSRGNPWTEGGVDVCVLIDRKIDLISLLTTSFNYQSLLPAEGSKTFYSDDVIFKQIRNMPIQKLGAWLKQKAAEIAQVYAEKEKIQDFEELQNFMEKFKISQLEHTCLSEHVNLASDKIEQPNPKHLKFEDQILSGSENYQTLINMLIDRLEDPKKKFEEDMKFFCLISLIYGIKSLKDLETIKTLIIENYGIEKIRLLGLLEFMEFFSSKPQIVSDWFKLKTAFNLIVNPDDKLSGIFAGYIPLTVRLVEMLGSASGGWRGNTDLLSMLNGPTLEIAQDVERLRNPQEIVAVCFIGGITLGELACLRELEEKLKTKYLVITDEIISAKKLLNK
jgi:Sec1 family